MKALKGVMVYIGIVLMAIVLICALVIGIMFFGKVNIFGYYFVQVNERDIEIKDNSGKAITVDMSGDSYASVTSVDLTITADKYSVKVLPTDSESVYVTVDTNYIGFLKDPRSEEQKAEESKKPEEERRNIYVPSAIVNKVNNTSSYKYELKIVEPQGLMSVSDKSVVYVHVPFSLGESVIEYNVNVTTGNGNIILSNSLKEDNKTLYNPLNVKSLTLNTKKGSAIMQGFGNKTGESVSTLVLNKLQINTVGGVFDFTKFSEVKVNRGLVKLTGSNSTYKFKTLNVGKTEIKDTWNTLSEVKGDGGVLITGENIKFFADNVYCGQEGFIYKAETGMLNVSSLICAHLQYGLEDIKEIKKGKEVVVGSKQISCNIATPYEITIMSNSSDIVLGKVAGKFGAYNEYGSIKISKLMNQASIRTVNGNIHIDASGYNQEIGEGEEKNRAKVFSITSSLILYSEYGDIYVGEYYQDGIFNSLKGNVEVNSKYVKFSQLYPYEDYQILFKFDFTTQITTKDGRVTATTEMRPMDIVSTNNGTINLTIVEVAKLVAAQDTLPIPHAGYYYYANTKGTINAKIITDDTYYVNVDGKVNGSLGSYTLKQKQDVLIGVKEEGVAAPRVKLVASTINVSKTY